MCSQLFEVWLQKRKAWTDTVNHQRLPPNFSLIPKKNMAPPQIQHHGIFSFFLISRIMLCRQSFQISVAYHHKTLISLPCIIWLFGAGLMVVGAGLFTHFSKPKTAQGKYISKQHQSTCGQALLYKQNISPCPCPSSDSIPLAKKTHMTKPHTSVEEIHSFHGHVKFQESDDQCTGISGGKNGCCLRKQWKLFLKS